MNRDLSSPPRAARLRRSYRLTRVLLLVLSVGLPGALLFFGLRDAQVLRRLAEEGVTTRGKVEGKRIRKGSKGSKRYTVRYRYEAAGQSLIGSDRISRRRYESVKTGDQVLISFLPSDPSVNCFGRVSIETAIWKARSIWIAAGVIAFGFGLAMFFCERTWRRFFLLLREGRAIEGEVIAYETFKQRKKKDSLRYRFRTPAGGTIEGHDRLQTAPVPLPEPGAPVTVLQERGEKKNYATLARVLEFAILQEKYERA